MEDSAPWAECWSCDSTWPCHAVKSQERMSTWDIEGVGVLASNSFGPSSILMMGQHWPRLVPLGWPSGGQPNGIKNGNLSSQQVCVSIFFAAFEFHMLWVTKGPFPSAFLDRWSLCSPSTNVPINKHCGQPTIPTAYMPCWVLIWTMIAWSPRNVLKHW